ncbi:MAG: GH1 family beta-glucosidase [Spirochaetaceae bacterium]
MSKSYKMPKDFLWGCSTSAYQVEGAVNIDGRGKSIWDTFSHIPGKIKSDHNGDISCDQYNLYKDDIVLMKNMGLKSYRFSISWPRVFPNGKGEFNEKGIDYYSRLVDSLLEANIEPCATLFHWDLPQVLEDQYGGWESKETSKYFGDYAGIISERLSDRLKNYYTLNDYICIAELGYRDGVFAPGKTLSRAKVNQVFHNGLLGHGYALKALRENAKGDIKVGLSDNPYNCVPIFETEEHIAAAKQAFHDINGSFLSPLLEGSYSKKYLEEEGDNAPDYTLDEMKLINAPIDYLGINMYYPTYIRADKNSAKGYNVVDFAPSHPSMDLPWIKVGPETIYWSTRYVNELWDVKSIYVTESGSACNDKLNKDGEVLDTDRIFYLRNHFIGASRAIEEGYPLKGYFVWSFLDNFEWAEGYTKRFGLVYVNFENQKRTPKLSAEYYKNVIKHNRIL